MNEFANDIKTEINSKKTTMIPTSDWFLIFGLLLSTMTSFRITGMPIGPGEICILLWMVWKSCFTKRTNSKISGIRMLSHGFWLVMLITFLIGTVINRLFFLYPNSVRNLIAYFYCFVFIKVCADHLSAKETVNVLKKLVFWGTILFFVLFLFGKFDLFGGAYVWGIRRFKGGASNPNQLALLLCPFPLFSLVFGKEYSKRTQIKGFGWLCLCVLDIFLCLKIQSDAVTAAWIVSILALFWVISYRLHNNGLLYRTILAFCMCIVVLAGVALIYKAIMDVFFKLDQDGSRFNLWIKAGQAIYDSAFIGFGPGFFCMADDGKFWEAHNTLLDFTIQGGLGFGVFFIYFLAKLYGRIKRKPLICCAFITVVMFSMGHFVGRHPVFYFFLFSFFAFGQEEVESQEGAQLVEETLL